MYRDLISSGDATGDEAIARELVALRGRTTPIVAAALVDLRRDPPVRTATLKTTRPRSLRSAPLEIPVDESRFEIGSITKALTGMLLADAIERDEVALETTASSLAPQLGDAPVGDVTLRELCTHTSGLPRLPRGVGMAGRKLRFALLGLDPYRGLRAGDVLAGAAGQRLQRRGSYRYSNVGAALAGQLLARAAGTDYAALLRARILAPLGMDATGISTRGDAAAPGHSVSGLRRQPWLMDGYAPAGGAYSTIDDIARLATALLNGTAPGLRSLDELDGVDPSGANRGAGMFWIVERDPDETDPQRRMLWHNGETGGYSAFLALFPAAARAVAVIANVARAPEQRGTALSLITLLSPRAGG